MQRTSAMSTQRRRLTAKTRWLSTWNQTIRHAVYTGNIRIDVLTVTHMSTDIHNSSCALHWSCLQTPTIPHVHTLVTSTGIHNSSCHTPVMSRLQTSTIINHVYALVIFTHIHNSSSHTGHVYRHPQFIMFTRWTCLQASLNTKHPQFSDQKCSP